MTLFATYFQRVNIVVWCIFQNVLKSENVYHAVIDSLSVDYLTWVKS